METTQGNTPNPATHGDEQPVEGGQVQGGAAGGGAPTQEQVLSGDAPAEGTPEHVEETDPINPAETEQALAGEGTPEAPLEGEEPPAGQSAADILQEEGEPGEEGTEEPGEEGAVSTTSLAQELFPDMEFGSEAEAASAIKEFAEGAREFEKTTKEANQKLVNIFNQNPEVVQLIRLMNEGASFVEALPYAVDVESMAPAEGDPDYQAWNEAKEKGAAQRAEREKAMQEVSKNLEMSMQEVDKFAKENEMSPEEAGEFLTNIDELISNISKGNITKDILDKLRKGLFHEKTVAEETQKAEVRGRNEAMEEKITKEEAEAEGDGLPDVDSGAPPEKAEEAIDDPAGALGASIEDYVQTHRRF